MAKVSKIEYQKKPQLHQNEKLLLFQKKKKKNEKTNLRQGECKSVKMLVVQSCPTVCNPMEHRPLGSSVHGILQARILEWVAILFSRGYSLLRDRTCVSCIAGRFFTTRATREAANHIFDKGFLYKVHKKLFKKQTSIIRQTTHFKMGKRFKYSHRQQIYMGIK